MEDSDYTNLQVHVLTKNQTTKKINKGFYFSKCNTTHRKKCCELQFRRIWQGYTHPTPTVSIAYILVSCIPKVLVVGEGAFLNKRWTHTHDWKDCFGLLLSLIVDKLYMLLTANTFTTPLHKPNWYLFWFGQFYCF